VDNFIYAQTFLENVTVTEFWKLVYICWHYDQKSNVVFGTWCRQLHWNNLSWYRVLLKLSSYMWTLETLWWFSLH